MRPVIGCFLCAGKEVRHGAEHQERPGQTDSGSAAAVHQPAGEAPPDTRTHTCAGEAAAHLLNADALC